MKFLKDFFRDNSGVSMMRLMSLLSLIFGAYLAAKHADATTVGIFVASAFGGKVIQKGIELNQK